MASKNKTSGGKTILTSRPETEKKPVETPKPMKPGHKVLTSKPETPKKPIDNRRQVPPGKKLLKG